MNASGSRRETRGLGRMLKAAYETFTGGSSSLVYVSKRFIVLPLGEDTHKNEEAIKQLQRDHSRYRGCQNADPDPDPDPDLEADPDPARP